MDNTGLQQLVDEMPFEEAEKKALLADIANGVSPDEVVEKIKGIIQAKSEALEKAHPEAAADRAAADKEYADEVAKASAQFDATMAQIEKEADEVGAEVMKRIDSARADEVKDSI